MEVFFKRNVFKSYMVIKDGGGNGCDAEYAAEIFKRNRLAYFLPFEAVWADGEKQYWYEITGLQILDSCLEQNGADYGLLKKLVASIEACLYEAESYLLSEDDICFSTDTIAIRPETGEVFFSYLPGSGQNAAKQLRGLIEEVLPQVDHKDSRAVEAIYAAYEVVLQDNYGFEEIKKCFETGTEESEAEKETPDAAYEISKSEPADVRISEPKQRKAADKLTAAMEKLKQKLAAEMPESLKERVDRRKEKKDIVSSMQISFEPEDIPKAGNPTVQLTDFSEIIGKLNYNGRNGEENFLIEKEDFLIGSKEDSVDACLRSAAVSRVHARISKKDGTYFLEDLNSKNGTWLNEELLNYREPRPLEKDARIRFADEEYIFG